MREAEQRNWTAAGDYARLSAAFADLAANGFVARMNFTCCSTCGHGEIADERTAGEHSYVFFHQQDSERLCEPEASLYLAFGFFDSHPKFDTQPLERYKSGDKSVGPALTQLSNDLDTAVGGVVVDALKRNGLDVSWSGSGVERPLVKISDWRKPLLQE